MHLLYNKLLTDATVNIAIWFSENWEALEICVETIYTYL